MSATSSIQEVLSMSLSISAPTSLIIFAAAQQSHMPVELDDVEVVDEEVGRARDDEPVPIAMP